MRLTLKATGRGTPRTVRPAIAGAVLRRLVSDTDDTRAQSGQPTDLGGKQALQHIDLVHLRTAQPPPRIPLNQSTNRWRWPGATLTLSSSPDADWPKACC